MAQKALGRAFNAAPAADGKWVNLAYAGGTTFLAYLTGGVGDTFTLQEAKDSAGTGAQNLACVTEYFTSTGDGSDAWTRHSQSAAATVATAAATTENAAVFEVEGTQLSDGYQYVKVTATGAGTVAALARDLEVQRAPENLPAMGS